MLGLVYGNAMQRRLARKNAFDTSKRGDTPESAYVNVVKRQPTRQNCLPLPRLCAESSGTNGNVVLLRRTRKSAFGSPANAQPIKTC